MVIDRVVTSPPIIIEECDGRACVRSNEALKVNHVALAGVR